MDSRNDRFDLATQVDATAWPLWLSANHRQGFGVQPVIIFADANPYRLAVLVELFFLCENMPSIIHAG